MNSGKEVPSIYISKNIYEFPSIICFFFRTPYRQLEGFIGRIFACEPGLLASDYITFYKRLSKLDLWIDIPENDAEDSEKSY